MHCYVSDDPVVAVYPKIQGFRKGESFSLTCDTVGQYAPAITWLKDNKKLDMNPRIQRGPANELYISDALPSDQGQYTCKADYSSLRPNTVKEDSAIAEYRSKYSFWLAARSSEAMLYGRVKYVRGRRPTEINTRGLTFIVNPNTLEISLLMAATPRKIPRCWIN